MITPDLSAAWQTMRPADEDVFLARACPRLDLQIVADGDAADRGLEAEHAVVQVMLKAPYLGPLGWSRRVGRVDID